MRSFLFTTALLTAPLSIMATLQPAQAQTTADASPTAAASPSQFIQTLADTALSSITGKQLSDAETTIRFRTLLRENFDLKSIGRFALGPYFNSATPAQREAYQAAFENMIVDSYAIRFRDYTGGSLKTGRVMQQGNDTLVDSQIVQSNGAPPIGVTWRVRNEAGAMKIIDVAVEGVSMSQTERSEFSSLIEQHGGQVQPLIDALQNHQVGLENPNQQ